MSFCRRNTGRRSGTRSVVGIGECDDERCDIAYEIIAPLFTNSAASLDYPMNLIDELRQAMRAVN